MNTIAVTPAKQTQRPEHKPEGRPPERFEEVSGDEAKGMTPVSTQNTVQPDPAPPPKSAPIVSQSKSPTVTTKPLAPSPISGKPL